MQLFVEGLLIGFGVAVFTVAYTLATAYAAYRLYGKRLRDGDRVGYDAV